MICTNLTFFFFFQLTCLTDCACNFHSEMQHDFFLQYGVATFITLAIIITQSAGRDLRPSEHGLAYQEDASPPPTQKQMLSFFGSAASSVPLPETGDDTWRSVDGDGRSGYARRDRARIGLIVGSAVCGIAGVLLLAVSTVVFLVRRRKRSVEGLSSN